ncbi:hypothetical protein R1sor_012496 [Riccia sorocarpa]|uniref:NB-ARC domain-containing protein n=1 Tax=Riccia sorocarpa TaxID=122646 RepID=A0ABD3I7Q6_9MARC
MNVSGVFVYNNREVGGGKQVARIRRSIKQQYSRQARMGNKISQLDGASSSKMQNKRPRLDGASSSRLNHEVESTQEEIRKVSDALYVLFEPKPAESANLDIFFFHGLECEGADDRDAHFLTWRSTGGKQEIWPQKWLPEDFPQARIISVSYDGCTKQTETEGRMDLYLIGESLVQEIRWARERCPNRPVILVGHGFGGVVLKKLCVNAQEKKGNSEFGKDMDMLLESIRGFFFYSTPHSGIEGMPPQAENEGLLLRWMRMLDSNSARLHGAFSSLWRERRYRWTIYGVGEVESTPERHGLRVREASARFGDNYITVPGDHFSVCRPSDRNNNKYIHLRNLIEDVQRQAELEMKPPLLVPKMTVGVDLSQIVEKHIRDHRFVGFWGMGGVGKTTLAKLIFNKLYAKFEFSCFVEEIKQLSGTKDEVKKKIWEKICRHGVPVGGASGSGTGDWYQLTGRSLLLVFDDVQDPDHVKLLKEIAHDNKMEGSRFILTSRDANRLRDCEPEYKINVRRLDELEFEDAKRLFVTYAFPDQQEPPELFRRVVKEIVNGCGGLPLTLEVLGNYLKDKEMEHWEEIPTALGECDQVADLEEKVWAKLQLSYDRLPEKGKYMFLEIASCGEFFNAGSQTFSVDDAILAWNSIYGCGRNHLQTLENRALVRILDNRRFYMHEHLRKMGQRIAKPQGRGSDLSKVYLRGHSSSYPSYMLVGARRYPLDDKVIFQEDEELGKIVAQGNYIDEILSDVVPGYGQVAGRNCPFCIVCEVWPKLTAIQYMQLVVGTFGCCQKCRNQGCPLPNTLVLFRLCFRKYAHNGDFVVSGGGRNFPGITRKTLVLVSTSTSLVLLKLENCINVDLGGLNELRRLRILKISQCRAIRNWPTSLRELKNLKLLELVAIAEPFELPGTLGNLTNLEHLYIDQCKVGYIPSSLQHLTNLRVLKVSEVVGRQPIPDILRFLRRMEILHLKCWGVVNLMDALREMTALTELHLECEGIQELPDTLGNLTNLEKLQLRCPIECLPGSFANLTRIETLKLEGSFGMVKMCAAKRCVVRLREDEIVHPISPLLCSLQGFMTKQKGLRVDCQHGMSAVIVRNMIGLESLEIKVRGPQAIPDVFRDLQKLRIFKLTCEAMERSLVESLEHLSSLENLDLACKTVERLPDVFGCFSTLKKLRIECPSLQALPNSFGNFTQLTTLRISATGLRTLPDSFAQLSQLQVFHLTGRDILTTFPDLAGCSSSLLRLRLGPWEISRITSQTMWQLPRLEKLEVSGHNYPWVSGFEAHRWDLPETIWPRLKSLFLLELQKPPEALGDLHYIRYLECERCGFEGLPESLGRLSGLTRLTIRDCGNLKTLPETIGELSSLTKLELVNTYALHSLPESVGRLSSLRDLSIRSCRTLPETIGDLSNLLNLYLSASALPCPSHTFWDLSKLKVNLRIWDSENLEGETKAKLYRLFGPSVLLSTIEAS